MLYMLTFTINIPPMLAYIPYMDPMGIDIFRSLEEEGGGKTRFLHIFNLGDHPMFSFGESPHRNPGDSHVQLSVPFLDTLLKHDCFSWLLHLDISLGGWCWSELHMEFPKRDCNSDIACVWSHFRDYM